MISYMVKILFKIGGVFYKLHKLFYNCALRMEEPKMSISDVNKLKWHKDKCEKILRYEYDLDENSIIMDVGAYEGDFASEMFARYRPIIYVFEPVSIYIKQLHARFEKNTCIHIIPLGLGAKSDTTTISIMDEASSYIRNEYMYKRGATESVGIIGIEDFMKINNVQKVDLIKINIEGAEYDLLDKIIELNMLKKFKNLQIQFHDFYPNFQARYNVIRKGLEKTHQLTYEYPFVWENWRLK